MARSGLDALAFALALGFSGCAPVATAKSTATLPEDKDPVYLFEHGKRFAMMGDTVRAEQYLSAAIAAGADENKVTPIFLHVCVAARHYRLAIEYADAALARHPDNAKLRFLAGALHKDIGEPARAREYLEEAARQLRDDAEVQFAVAVFFRDDLKDTVAADPYFREYLRISPQGTHAEEARVSLMVRLQ
jgi:tetratricopeptide (TPR) repeat protein